MSRGATIVTASEEDYLEAVYALQRIGGPVRTSAIADALGVRRASVSVALRRLAQRGLVEHDAYGTTVLTPLGRRLARSVSRRHRVLREFFEDILGLDPAESESAACAMEHAAPATLPSRLAALTKLLRARADLRRAVRSAGSPGGSARQ